MIIACGACIFFMKSISCTESLRNLLDEVMKRPLITECIGKDKPVNMIF